MDPLFLSEKMLKEELDQALPITAGLVSTTAFLAMLWCFADGYDEARMGIDGIAGIVRGREYENGGIGRPLDERRLDVGEFLHRNYHPGTRAGLGGK